MLEKRLKTMKDEYITLKSYDNKLVRVLLEEKDEYILNQKRIKIRKN